jgi:hypothetical protein
MQKVFAKYGEASMTFEVIERVADRLFLLPREQFQLWRHAGLLMNGKDTVAPGVSFTEEVLAKMSAKRRARPGKPCSEETKQRLSAANKGKKRSRDSVERAQAARLSWVAVERPAWLAMRGEGKSYRDIEAITGRSRKLIARECTRPD